MPSPIEKAIRFISERDVVRILPWRNDSIVMHDDHRWTLALIAAAASEGRVPIPCTLISFDMHEDGFPPRKLERLAACPRPASVEDVLSLCDEGLRHDDWVKAGMDIGLISDAVIFGARINPGDPHYTDRCGGAHRIFPCCLPGGAMEHQGELVDRVCRDLHGPLWRTLAWEPHNESFRFAPQAPPIFLTIDLDCFVGRQVDVIVPFHSKVYARHFHAPSTLAPGWTGTRFFQALLARAGCIDIAREPGCCGGEDNSEEVLRDVDRHLFDGELRLSGGSAR